MRKICVIGMGYVGTTLAVTLADAGFDVVGAEVNPRVRDTLNLRVPHFHENGLEKLLEKHIGKRLVIKEKIDDGCDTYVICVSTPIDTDKRPMLKYVENSAAELGSYIKKGDLVVLRSTVPVGTTRKTVIPILERLSKLSCGRDFHVVFAPERTAEGKALEELRELPQIIGGFDDYSAVLAANIFMRITPTLVKVSSLEAAEIVKILDNTYRDIRFAYANEIAMICERLDVSASEVIKAANMGYKRNSIPLPSPGVGGACLSKDPHILVDLAKKIGYDARLIRTGREINEHIPAHIAEEIRSNFVKAGIQTENAKIFVIGFAFKGKPETSDTRESSTIPLVKDLLAMKAKVYGYDPVAPASDIRATGAIPASLEEGFNGASCVVIMNNHDSYYNINLDKLLDKTENPCFFIDGWNMFSPLELREKKHIRYGGVGCQIH